VILFVGGHARWIKRLGIVSQQQGQDLVVCNNVCNTVPLLKNMREEIVIVICRVQIRQQQHQIWDIQPSL